MSKATLATVQGIKTSLEKEVAKGDDISSESVKDMLDQLDKCNMTMAVLTKSLIGTVVSKLKKHDDLGPPAKALVKKWKKVAKDAEANKQAKKAERRSSNNSAAAAAAAAATDDQPLANAEEWDDLLPQQKIMCQKLHKFLRTHKPALVKDGINEEAVDHLLVSRATEIEAAMTTKFKNNRAGYAEKARTLCFNLKKNAQLAEQVILGQIEADKLITMSSEEMASSEARKAREEEAKKLVDSKRLDWDQANEDKINEMCGIKGDLLKASLFTCGRCKSVKTTSTQKQTRSADEPMTVFVLCLNCGKRWKC
ncbi:Transcription elongation factor A protein 2 [Seminavis robusta]|uniref:Transcription elongation factor A protein 2 n=1 Tax=Seminavis robusta TaxID=568900 RepID=A0A9N8D683_9STRA|nr:Transcription elongation factor A protein 2 [Seminavis robusta]|eukprot:Sro15_g011060.1 Transcription elongation factor A protein 2 (310) ;mRNA; f:62579-63508